MPSLLHLTPIHFRVYKFIVNFKKAHDGVSPSFAEIAQGCKLSSTSTVSQYLNSLVLFGMIECKYGRRSKSRMISIPGARWVPPSTGDFSSSPLKREDHGKISVSSTTE